MTTMEMVRSDTEDTGGGLTRGELIERLDTIKQANSGMDRDKAQIRAIMDGGADGLRALLGSMIRGSSEDVPAANLIGSGMERLAQKLKDVPMLRADIPARSRDEEAARERGEARERIVEHYDRVSKLHMQMPQLARWLVGYGYGVGVLKHWVDPRNGHPYPKVELRDPWECYPGPWGVDQEPTELVTTRQISPHALARIYPLHADTILTRRPSDIRNGTWEAGGLVLNPTSGTWESQGGGGLTIQEYFNPEGTWIYLPDRDLILDYQPNPLRDRPRFRVVKRFAFNKLVGHYKHVVGLQAQYVKMTVLELIALQDTVMAETHVVGDVASRQIRRGRHQTNFWPAGTTITQPTKVINPQVFTALDRVERMFRVGSAYSLMDDSQSPTSFSTGKGLDKLAEGPGLVVEEYQLIIADFLEELDSMRLEWDERMYRTGTKPLVRVKDGAPFTETYRPDKDIKGNWITRRVYGPGAGLDEAGKIVTILQLMQARLMDRRTALDQLRGIDDAPKILRNVLQDEAEVALMRILEATAMAVEDPDRDRARMSLIELNKTPHRKNEILDKFFTPNEPELSEQEQQFLEPEQGIQLPSKPPPVSSVLSRLESSGATEGGVQTVGRM